MLVVDSVSVSLGGRSVLDAVSLEVSAGEVVAVFGPSGSGKSTLLRAVAGLVEVESGRVVIDGVDVTGVPTHRRRVGMVFQDEQLFPHRDVAGNVAFGLEMAGVGRRERESRVEELLSAVGLDGFGDRDVSTLSGGEAKRVALARSLAPKPAVLLADEPLTGLDADLHDRLAVEVGAVLRESGTTTLWVTHDRAEAALVADRSVSLADLSGVGG
ncbi:MAG: ATP-binding cassette domain-containing protein [Actinobacteria bacterium]|nr:ATP-binding cassette domain-containing protein [Actinomycetota bacterium]